jgi:hypothetical protein
MVKLLFLKLFISLLYTPLSITHNSALKLLQVPKNELDVLLRLVYKLLESFTIKLKKITMQIYSNYQLLVSLELRFLIEQHKKFLLEMDFINTKYEQSLT